MSEEEKVEAGATSPEETPTEPTDQEEFLAGMEEETTPPSEKKETTPAKKEEVEEKVEQPTEVEPEEEPEKTVEDWQAENEDLKKQLAEKEKALTEKETQEPEEKEFEPEEMPEEVKQYLEDYPEAKDTIEYIMRNEVGRQLSEIFGTSNLTELREEVKDLKAFINNMDYSINFEAVVLGGYYNDADGTYIEGHADAKQIARTKQWETWIKAKSKKDASYSAPESPQKAIEIISEYKSDMAKKAASTHDKKLAKDAGKTRETIAETVEGGKTGGTPPTETDKDSFDAGFQEEL